MSFDGEIRREGEFANVKSAWERSNDWGSRWFFYPFHFVTSASGKTIKDAPTELKHFIGQKVKIIQEIFLTLSRRSDMLNADIETFAANL